MMTELMLTKCADLWDEIVVAFANTAQENEETLEFVHKCDQQLHFNTVWLEAVVHPESRVGTTHKVVTFETASRNGEPYEAVIQKYGIPNMKAPMCTRELKQRPMVSYLRNELGWEAGSYDTAIGIRADEAHRRGDNHLKDRIIYPLLDALPTTKPQVNLHWSQKPFRLQLAGYQGNCKWCWKKSMRKLLTIMEESPEAFDFPERMEGIYGTVGPEFKKPVKLVYPRRYFFRGGLSVAALREMTKTTDFSRAENDALLLPDGTSLPMDGDGGCSESCEVDFTEEAVAV